MKNKPKYYELSKDIIKTKGKAIYEYENYDFESRAICKKISRSIKTKNYLNIFEFFEDFNLSRKIEIMIHFPEIHMIAPIDWSILFENFENKESNIYVNKIIDNISDLPEYISKEFTKELHKTILNIKSDKVTMGGYSKKGVEINILGFLDSQNILIDIDLNNIVISEYVHDSDVHTFIELMKRRGMDDYAISLWILKNMSPETEKYFQMFEIVKNSRNISIDDLRKTANIRLIDSFNNHLPISPKLFEYLIISLLNNKDKAKKEFGDVVEMLIYCRRDLLSDHLFSFSSYNTKGILNDFIERSILDGFAKYNKNKNTHITFYYMPEDEMYYLNHAIKTFNGQLAKLSKTSKEYNFSFEKLEYYNKEKHNYKHLIPAAIESLKKLFTLVLLQNNMIEDKDDFTMSKIYPFFKEKNEKIYLTEFIEKFSHILNADEEEIYSTLNFIRLLMKQITKENITLVKNNSVRKPMSPKSYVLRKLSSGVAYTLDYNYMKNSKTKTKGYIEFIYEKCAGLEKIISNEYPFGIHYKINKDRDYSKETVRDFFKDVEENIKIKIACQEPYLMEYMTIDWKEGLKKIKNIKQISNLYSLNKLSRKNKEIINEKIYKLDIPRYGKYIIGSPNEIIWLFLLKNNFEINLNIDKPGYTPNYLNEINPNLYLLYCLEKKQNITNSTNKLMVLPSNDNELSPTVLAIKIWYFILENGNCPFDSEALFTLSKLLAFFTSHNHANEMMDYEIYHGIKGNLYKFIELVAEANIAPEDEVELWIERINSEWEILDSSQKDNSASDNPYIKSLIEWLNDQYKAIISHMPITKNIYQTNADVIDSCRKFYFSEDPKSFEIFMIISMAIWEHEKYPRKAITLAIMIFIDEYFEKPIKRDKRPEWIS
ncbi:MAG: hypothetical protein KAG14_01135 [Mycoplasmataceae bacterium]|nr:hypothetical protein [Mycoplasmataceae bacterium]